MKEEKETPGQTSALFYCDTHCPCATVASHLYKYMGVTKKKCFFLKSKFVIKLQLHCQSQNPFFFLLLVAHPGRAGKMIRTLSLKYLSTTSFKNLNIIATKIHY